MVCFNGTVVMQSSASSVGPSMWILSSNLNDEKFNVHLAYDTVLQKLLDVKLAFVQY
jgi:hypothetical protein